MVELERGWAMLFSDLLSLSFDSCTDIIDISTILAALPNTPAAVAQQVYADHGRKAEFQAAYGHLDIARLNWKLLSYPASKLSAATVNPPFRAWFDVVGSRVRRFPIDGWNCVDTRSYVLAHWQECGTWLTPPVLLSGHIVNSPSEFHLVEGHTRLGLLVGLLQHRVLSTDSVHKVWLGNDNAGWSDQALLRP